MTNIVTVEVEGLEPAEALRWVAAALAGHRDLAARARANDSTASQPTRVHATAVSRGHSDIIFRIKTIREHTRCGLKEAKEAIEACEGDTVAAIALIERVGLGDHASLKRKWTPEDVAAVLRHAVNEIVRAQAVTPRDSR